MTREQAAEQLYGYGEYPEMKAFLAGCEHADKEHRERIEQQAQEIERLKWDFYEAVKMHQNGKERITELEAQLKELIPFLQERIRRAYVAIGSKTEDQTYPFDGRGEMELQGMKRAYSDVLTTIQSPKEQPKFGDWTPEKIAEWKKRTGQEQPEAQQQEEYCSCAETCCASLPNCRLVDQKPL